MAARVRAADRTRGTPPSRHPFDAPACVRSRPRRAVRRLPRHHSRALHPRCLPCHPVSGIMPSAHSRPPARFGPPARRCPRHTLLRSTRSLAHASAPHGASHPCANLPICYPCPCVHPGSSSPRPRARPPPSASRTPSAARGMRTSRRHATPSLNPTTLRSEDHYRSCICVKVVVGRSRGLVVVVRGPC